MSKTCSTCGQTYPDNFRTCTCRFCGGIIENTTPALYSLDPNVYKYEQIWQEWKKKYEATPPRPLREEDWLKSCSYFNHCSICGGNIEEKLLVIPPILGGKLYHFNVLPACEVCAKRIRQSQKLNPVKSFYTIQGANKQLVDLAFKYLEALMLDIIIEDFDFDEDELEIVVTCTEDTSIDRFTGVYAKRIFNDKGPKVLRQESMYTTDKKEEFTGVTWRLLDE